MNTTVHIASPLVNICELEASHKQYACYSAVYLYMTEDTLLDPVAMIPSLCHQRPISRGV